MPLGLSCFGWYKFNFSKDTTLIDDLTRKILRLVNTMQTVTKSNFVSIIRLSKKPHRIGTGQNGSEGGQTSQLPAFPYGENYCVINDT